LAGGLHIITVSAESYIFDPSGVIVDQADNVQARYAQPVIKVQN